MEHDSQPVHGDLLRSSSRLHSYTLYYRTHKESKKDGTVFLDMILVSHRRRRGAFLTAKRLAVTGIKFGWVIQFLGLVHV